MKLENVSFRQAAVGIFLLALLNWAFLQFVALPNIPEQDRKGIYSGWVSSPYSYAISIAAIAAFSWYAFSYRGRYTTHGKRIAAFAMAFAGLCGMLIVVLIRVTWHL